MVFFGLRGEFDLWISPVKSVEFVLCLFSKYERKVYVSQTVGFKLVDLFTLTSRSSMNRMTRTDGRGAPLTFSDYLLFLK